MHLPLFFLEVNHFYFRITFEQITNCSLKTIPLTKKTVIHLKKQHRLLLAAFKGNYQLFDSKM